MRSRTLTPEDRATALETDPFSKKLSRRIMLALATCFFTPCIAVFLDSGPSTLSWKYFVSRGAWFATGAAFVVALGTVLRLTRWLKSLTRNIHGYSDDSL